MTKPNYQNFIFDLYGTLIDIITDETEPQLWEDLARYMYEEFSVKYTAWGLREAYLKLCAEYEEKLKEILHVDHPEIRLSWVFEKLVNFKHEEPENENEQEVEMTESSDLPFDPKDIRLDPNLEELTDPKIQKLCIYFRERSRDKLELYPGVREVFVAIKKAGKKVFLLSNAQRSFTVKELDDTMLTGCFEDVFISSDKYIKKPQPEFLEMLIEKNELKKEECVMIGNEINCDIGIAAACGIKSVYLNTYDHPKREINADIKKLGITDEALKPTIIQGWKLFEIKKALGL
ncbi:MAG: HAD hydrolase-like protein [Butyrivibrio sp.]|nr:HAD hydrolase-like protein [Butyrivibrio sp.]